MACPIPKVGAIVRDLCAFVGVTNVITADIDDIDCRGFICAQQFSVADAIRALQRAYFFDLPEIDGYLVAVLRGGPIIATIPRSDMVEGEEVRFESAREQSIEFPQKLHIQYANAESDYVPTKQTSERRSKDIKSFSEMTVELPINLLNADALNIVEIMHKMAWEEMEGTAKVALSEKYHYLTASDPIYVEMYDGVYKRIRITKEIFVDGVIQVEGVVDRATAINNVTPTPPTPVDPVIPPSNVTVDTQYYILDLPALAQEHDTLHVYVVAAGETSGVWRGANVEVLIDTTWVYKGALSARTTMGAISGSLPSYTGDIDETNTLTVIVNNEALNSITQAEFDVGGNLALVGNEIINFRDAVNVGLNTFELTYIGRHLLHTYTTTHVDATRFIMLNNAYRVAMDSVLLGQTLTWRVSSIGNSPTVDDEQSYTFLGYSQIEWEPEAATMELISGEWVFNWVNNKRIGALNVGVTSQYMIATRIQLFATTGSYWFLVNGQDETWTLTAGAQTLNFGGAVTTWDAVYIYNQNAFTGLGYPVVPILLAGNNLEFEDTDGVFLIENGIGPLELDPSASSRALSEIRTASPGTIINGDIVYGVSGGIPKGLIREEIADLVGSAAYPRTKQHNFDAFTFTALGADQVTNGDFATDTDWVKGTGWTISGGAAHSDGTQSSDSNLTQLGLVDQSGITTTISFTISNYVSGGVGVKWGAAISFKKTSNGVFRITLPGSTNTTPFSIVANSTFVGTVDDVVIQELYQPTWDCETAEVIIMPVAWDSDEMTITNFKAGGVYTMILPQVNGAWWWITWPAICKWPGGVEPTLSVNPDEVDVVEFVSDGTNLYGSFRTIYPT